MVLWVVVRAEPVVVVNELVSLVHVHVDVVVVGSGVDHVVAFGEGYDLVELEVLVDIAGETARALRARFVMLVEEERDGRICGATRRIRVRAEPE